MATVFKNRSGGEAVKKSGDTMTGDLTVKTKVKCSNLPTQSDELCNKAYVDSLGAGSFLPLSGGTVTGAITLTTVPTLPGHLVNKTYCDTKLDVKTSGISVSAGGNLDMNSKYISNVATPVGPADGCNKAYADTKLGVGISGINISGSGNLDMNSKYISNLATPLSGPDACNKSYCDTKMSLTGGQFTGAVSVGAGNRLTLIEPPNASTDATNKTYCDNKMPKTGGQFTGPVAVGTGNTLTLIEPPGASTDATNKTYCDNKLLKSAIRTQTGTIPNTSFVDITLLTLPFSFTSGNIVILSLFVERGTGEWHNSSSPMFAALWPGFHFFTRGPTIMTYLSSFPSGWSGLYRLNYIVL
jgi:hypothetical protein